MHTKDIVYLVDIRFTFSINIIHRYLHNQEIERNIIYLWASCKTSIFNIWRVKVFCLIHRKIKSNSIWIIGWDKLVPNVKVSPVDCVENQEQDRGQHEEKPGVQNHGKEENFIVYTCIHIVDVDCRFLRREMEWMPVRLSTSTF